MERNSEIYHHGIKGQHWGDRNGPPYPLKGGQYSKAEKDFVLKRKIQKNSIYDKKHVDKTIKEGTTLSTLSYDKNRTTNTDMFYSAYDAIDKHQYNALFNKKIPQTIYNEDGNAIGTGSFYKFRINNKAVRNIKVASEDSGSKAFLRLYSSNRDFYNFVRDPDRMESLFVKDKYRFKGYRESLNSLNRVRNQIVPSEKDLRAVYRMYNYTIPNDGNGNNRVAKDVYTQRAKFFKELKNAGYSAVLDTNDAIYGGFKTNAPVIVFDQEAIALHNVERVKTSDKMISELVFVGKKVL